MPVVAVEKGFVYRKFLHRDLQVWMRNEVLALIESTLNCCAMSNLLLRKRLKEKELQTLGLVSRSVLFYLCASGFKQLQSGSHSALSPGHSTVFLSGVTPICELG